ncbi:MAG: DUF3631 domain-containing protein, partial [Crenarchaeota archaeon]|nr:DUF3631 domain-containing protein [Thermoproteota archaeon]
MMSKPQTIDIDLEIYQINENKLMIKDKRARYLFVFKKNKSSISFYVGVRGKPPYKPHRPFREISVDVLKKFLSMIDDEVLRANCDIFAEKLYAFYESWDQRLDEIETALEIQKFFEDNPLATIQTPRGEIVILASDGYSIKLSGGVVRRGRRTFAVFETTYAYVAKNITTRKGAIIETTTISPIMIISEYNDGKLTKVYLVDPDSGVVKVFDKFPVKIEGESKAATDLPTLLDSETLVKIYRGEYIPPGYGEVFSEIIGGLKKYVNFEWDERLYSVVAAYILFTYFFDFFTTSPRLFFLGPFGSGKTRAMITATYMSRHGFVLLDPSEASTYRSIEAYGPTLGIDESALNDRLLKIISAGYKKGLKVPRIEKARGESFILKLFETYGPVIMSFTDPLPEMIMQRTIVINMERTSDPNPERRDPEPHDFEDLRRKLYALRILRANEFVKAMDKVREKISGIFYGREYEIWYPILVAAYLGGEKHFESVLEYALDDLNKRRETLYSEEKTILAAIDRLFEARGEDTIRFTATDLQTSILELLQSSEGYTEKEIRRTWDTRRIGRILKRLGLRRKSERIPGIGPRYVYMISMEKFCDLSKRYGYECSSCSNCSNYFENTGEARVHENNGRDSSEPNGVENFSVSQKITTTTTITTDEQSEKMGIRQAILWIVSNKNESPITTYYIYKKLEEMMKKGLVIY